MQFIENRLTSIISQDIIYCPVFHSLLKSEQLKLRYSILSDAHAIKLKLKTILKSVNDFNDPLFCYFIQKMKIKAMCRLFRVTQRQKKIK